MFVYARVHIDLELPPNASIGHREESIHQETDSHPL